MRKLALIISALALALPCAAQVQITGSAVQVGGATATGTVSSGTYLHIPYYTVNPSGTTLGADSVATTDGAGNFNFAHVTATVSGITDNPFLGKNNATSTAQIGASALLCPNMTTATALGCELSVGISDQNAANAERAQFEYDYGGTAAANYGVLSMSAANVGAVYNKALKWDYLGNVYLPQLTSQSVLGTDASGKIIAGSGGAVSSLTTTGTSGAATLSGGVLNIPQYQGSLTLTTTGTSGAATLVGTTLNIPQYTGTGAFNSGLGTSYQDVAEIAAPANPAAGNDRLWLDSTTHQVSCHTSAGANCMPPSGGSVGPGTVNYIPLFATTTTVGNSHIDDGATTVGAVTSTEQINVSASGATAITGTEGAAATGVASKDVLWADTTNHRWMLNNNNGGAQFVPGVAAAGTAGHLVEYAANGVDLVDSGTASPNSAGPVFKQWTYVAETSSSAVASITSPAITVASGDLVYVSCRSGGTVTSITVSSTPANTWTAGPLDSVTSGPQLQGSWSIIGTSGSTTFTCAPSASQGFQSMIVLDYSGGTGMTANSSAIVSSVATNYVYSATVSTTSRTFNFFCVGANATSAYIASASIGGIDANRRGTSAAFFPSSGDQTCFDNATPLINSNLAAAFTPATTTSASATLVMLNY